MKDYNNKYLIFLGNKRVDICKTYGFICWV